MALDRKQKAFRLFKIMPIDANNINFEQAMVRLLVLLHTKGKLITHTRKNFLYPDDLVGLVKENDKYFEGVNDPIRERLFKNWIATDFATTVVEGKDRKGKPRISNFKPIHLSTIKMLDPRIRSQDRDESKLLYNVFKQSQVASDGDFLMKFLLEGTKKKGEVNLVIDETSVEKLDIETLFLLRLLEDFNVDIPSSGKNQVEDYKFLCDANQKQILFDTLKLLTYKTAVPRRELFNYLMILLRFHSALFAMKNFRLINNLVQNKAAKCKTCISLQSEADMNKLHNCNFHHKIFVDLTNGQDKTCDYLAKQAVEFDQSDMFRYFKSHYKLAKLDEYAKTKGLKDATIEQLTSLLDAADVEPYFQWKLSEFTNDEDLSEDPDVQAILGMNISNIDKYVEVICNDKSNWKLRTRNHKSMLSSLCGMNREDGFLQGGRGRKRKYVLGNLLLEVLVQIAVVGADERGFKTSPITIVSFVDWLKNRYGIYINEYPYETDSPEIAKALNSNFQALKERLRQLGFYTDLSDASNSQVIRPRFNVEPELV